MAVKWTKQTRSKDLVQEKVRKKVSDKMRVKIAPHKIDINKIIVARTRRFK